MKGKNKPAKETRKAPKPKKAKEAPKGGFAFKTASTKRSAKA
jgi:hypothetical protein